MVNLPHASLRTAAQCNVAGVQWGNRNYMNMKHLRDAIENEHGVLSTTGDKLLIDFVTRTTKRPDSKLLKEKYPAVYADVLKTSESRKLKVSVTPT